MDDTDRAMAARLRMKHWVDTLRETLKADKTAELVESTAALSTLLCGDDCDDELHMRHHQDIAKAVRSLDAVAAKWIEIRAHLAVASNALTPPKNWEPTPAPVEGLN